MDPAVESADAITSPEDRPASNPSPSKRPRSRARAAASAGTSTTGPIGDSTPRNQTDPDPGTAEGAQNPEIVVDTPDADAPSSGFNLFGFGSMLDGFANRFTNTASSPAKAKAAQEDADFYVFIAESIVLSRTMSLAVLPSEQEHKLMVLGLADIIRSDGRVTRIAKGMKWVALPVGAGLWGLRMFTEYMGKRPKTAKERQFQDLMNTPAPPGFTPPPHDNLFSPEQLAEMDKLSQAYTPPQPTPNGLEPQYGANKDIFG